MDVFLSISIVIRGIVLARSLMLWRRLGDWRLGVLSAVIFLMTFRQVLTLIEHANTVLEESQPWALVDFAHSTELPGLAVSVVALLGIVHLERWLPGLSRAERALRLSERSLAEAQRISHLGNWEWDAQTDVLQWSDEIDRIFGLEPQESEATLQSFLDVVHPEDRAGIQQGIQRTLEDGSRYDVEFRVIRPDGSERIVHSRAEVRCDVDGKPVSLFGTAQDIIDRKRAEEALRESEALYRNLFEHSPVGISITDAEGHILAMNDAMLEAGGYSRDDLARAPNVTEFYYDPADRARMFAALEKQGFVRQREVRMKRKDDGSPYYVLISVAPVTVDQKPCLLTIAEDITDRKEAEEAYRASNELQRLLLSQIDEVVYSVKFEPGDPLGGVADFVSGRGRTITGYTLEDLQRDPSLWIQSIHPEDLPGVRQSTEEILRTGAQGVQEYRLRHKETGAYRWMEDLAVPRFDEQHRVIGLFGVVRDVTRRKQADEELRRSREALRRLAIREQAVREEERTSIAREIHDQLGQAMTALRRSYPGSIGSSRTAPAQFPSACSRCCR